MSLPPKKFWHHDADPKSCCVLQMFPSSLSTSSKMTNLSWSTGSRSSLFQVTETLCKTIKGTCMLTYFNLHTVHHGKFFQNDQPYLCNGYMFDRKIAWSKTLSHLVTPPGSLHSSHLILRPVDSKRRFRYSRVRLGHLDSSHSWAYGGEH